MKSGLFKLYSNDFIKGLITAVFSSIIVTLYGVVVVAGFDFFTVDWNAILHNIINISGVTFIAYIAKNFLTDNQGTIAGIVKAD